MMMDPDSLQRFLFEHANVRGEMVRLEKTYQTILNQHAYPPLVKHLLGEALMSAALLAGSIKFEGSLSLQFHGDQRLTLLLVQCDHQLHLRALVKYDESSSDIDYNSAFLTGNITLVIEQYNQTQAYQSIVPIHSISMADNLSHYFAQSDQIPSRLWLATNEKQAAGMLLQLMPDTNVLEQEEFWDYAVKIGETITQHELLTLDNQTILQRLYHETEVVLYSAREISFRCQCNIDKMKQVLMVLDETDLQQLLKEQNAVVINCDFCNQLYTFNSSDLKMIFNNPMAPTIWIKNIE